MVLIFLFFLPLRAGKVTFFYRLNVMKVSHVKSVNRQ